MVSLIGRPQPQVRWLVNGVLVDDQYEHNTGDVIENRLLWPAVQRSDLNAIFTCQAVNTILVEPKENSYVLDLHRKYRSSFFILSFLFCFFFFFFLKFGRIVFQRNLHSFIVWKGFFNHVSKLSSFQIFRLISMTLEWKNLFLIWLPFENEGESINVSFRNELSILNCQM